MIEIICDKKGEEKNVEGETNASGEGFKLPKNIRQVGSPSGRIKIYIEDYVVTYLNYIARPGNTDVRGAILVGEKRQTEQGETLFISGAVDAQNVEFDMEECEFSQEIWSDIYEQIKEFFPELSVVGWFLSRMGFSTAINARIEKLHIENFPGSDKVLYVSDSLESEDAFYIYEKGQMVKQKGYYIYYAKNDRMQSYIIKQRKEDIGEEKSDIKRKDDELIKNYREKNRQAMENKSYNLSLGYVAGAFLSLVVLAMGITIAGNYKKMRNMEVSINRLEMTAEAGGNNVQAADAVVTPPSTDAIDAMNTEEQVPQENTPTDVAQTLEQGENTAALDPTTEASTTDPITEATTQAAVETGNENSRVVYKVRYGDTLSSIAEEYYGDIAYVSNIAQANNIGEDGKILDGQELVLPDIP